MTGPGICGNWNNVLERAYILETGNALKPESFPETVIIGSRVGQAMDDAKGQTLSVARQNAIDQFEHAYLARLLKKHHGKINLSAKEAHITTRQLTRLLAKHGLDKKEYKEGKTGQ